MYKAKKKVDLSHLFKLKIRKRPPVVMVRRNNNEAWQTLDGVTGFTEPTLKRRQHEWLSAPEDMPYLRAFFDNKSINEIKAMYRQEPKLDISE
nr:hypothetical protein [uncultured Psychrobacter sp.]